MTDETEEERRQREEEERKKKQRLYEREKKRKQRAKKKAKKWDSYDYNENGIAISGPVVPPTPTVKHGFYRKKLTPKEKELAEELHKEFHRKYDLDSLTDDMLLYTAITNFMKSLRKEPKNPDKNIRDKQVYHEREFRAIIDALGLSRKARKETDKSEEVAKQLANLFQKKKKEKDL